MQFQGKLPIKFTFISRLEKAVYNNKKKMSQFMYLDINGEMRKYLFNPNS